MSTDIYTREAKKALPLSEKRTILIAIVSSALIA